MFCPNCGLEVADKGVNFCPSCGADLSGGSQKPAEQSSQTYQQPSQTYQRQYQPPPQGMPPQGQGHYQVPMPPQRDYLPYLIGGIFLFGIPYIIYAYRNGQDLYDLEFASAHNRQGYYRGTQIEPVFLLILAIVFSPIYTYLKYQKLHEHLTLDHGQQHDLPNSPMYIVGWLIATIFLFWTIIVPLIAVFVIISAEFRWQGALNAHIRAHGGM